MRILLTGGTGTIGRKLIDALTARGDQVLAHTRKPQGHKPGVFWFEGDAAKAATFAQAMGSCDAVINLAGAPVASRWTESHRKAILKSRIDTTRALVQACQASAQKPNVWVNASAIGYYGPDPQGQCNESSPKGPGFLADVAGAWEAAAADVAQLGVRLIFMRLGVVLAAEGGMLPTLLLPVRAFVGGPLGDGQQWLSWIHVADAVRLFIWAVDTAQVQGPINAVAPNPARHEEMMARLGRITKRPIWLRVPAWAAKLAMGDMAQEMALASQNVVPKQALAQGFAYTYPHLDAALKNLLLPQ